jgi:hypothetical protein
VFGEKLRGGSEGSELTAPLFQSVSFASLPRRLLR